MSNTPMNDGDMGPNRFFLGKGTRTALGAKIGRRVERLPKETFGFTRTAGNAGAFCLVSSEMLLANVTASTGTLKRTLNSRQIYEVHRCVFVRNKIKRFVRRVLTILT